MRVAKEAGKAELGWRPEIVDESTAVLSPPHRHVGRLIYELLEGLLAARLVVIFFGANPTNDFVELIVRLTNPLVAQFRFVGPGIMIGRSLVEVSAVAAMLFITLIFFLLSGAMLGPKYTPSLFDDNIL